MSVVLSIFWPLSHSGSRFCKAFLQNPRQSSLSEADCPRPFTTGGFPGKGNSPDSVPDARPPIFFAGERDPSREATKECSPQRGAKETLRHKFRRGNRSAVEGMLRPEACCEECHGICQIVSSAVPSTHLTIATGRLPRFGRCGFPPQIRSTSSLISRSGRIGSFDPLTAPRRS